MGLTESTQKTLSPAAAMQQDAMMNMYDEMGVAHTTGVLWKGWPTRGGRVTCDKLLNVWEVNLSESTLSRLPPSIVYLTFLRSLNLRENKFKAVPPEIGQLRTLEKLNLESNPIEGGYENLLPLVLLTELQAPFSIMTVFDLSSGHEGHSYSIAQQLSLARSAQQSRPPQPPRGRAELPPSNPSSSSASSRHDESRLFDAKAAAVQLEVERRLALEAAERERRLAAEAAERERRRAAEAAEKAPRALKSLTSDEMGVVVEGIQGLRSFGAIVRAKDLSGEALSYYLTPEELMQDVGLSVVQARLLFSRIAEWKKAGLSRSLLMPARNEEPHSPPPNPSSSPGAVRGAGQIKLSGPLSAGKRSSGNSVVMDASLNFTSTSIFVKAKLGFDLGAFQREHETMSVLNSSHGRFFVRPFFSTLSGARGEIVSEYGDDMSSYYALVMEKGECDLGEYLAQKPTLTQAELRFISERLVDIVEAAHSTGYVLGDFKVQNIIRCLNGLDFDLKAIDFDNTRQEDFDLASDGSASTTPSIASPEMARFLLARAEKRPTPLKASWASDIFSLGLTIFYIANNRRSFWRTVGIDDSDSVASRIAVLQCSASLTDEAVQSALNVTFPRETHRALRNLLSDALKVNPAHRKTAKSLKNHSFVSDNDPTFNASQLAEGISKLATKEEMRDGFQTVQMALEEMNEKLDSIAFSQSELGISMRQAAVDASGNQRELKIALEKIDKTMSLSMPSRPIDGMDPGELQSLIKSIVSSSLAAMGEMEGCAELKRSMIDTVRQCSDNSEKTRQSDQLKQIIETLECLRDDARNVASEIKELRGDLALVNQTLGSQIQVLHSMVMNSPYTKYSPTTMIMLPRVRTSVLGKVQAAFKTEYVLFFVCPVTKKVVRSGPKGKGYAYSVEKQWVKRAAPVLVLGLRLAQVAAKAYGIPIPIPAGPSGMKTSALVDKMIEEVHKIAVEKLSGISAKEHKEMANAFDLAQNVLVKCNNGGGSLSSTDLDRAMGAHAYPAVRELLKMLEGAKGAGDLWKPLYSGLKMVTSDFDGSTMWVSEEGEAAFVSKGMRALY